MKKLTALFLISVFALNLPAAAVEDSQVLYFGGTSPAIRAGSVGTLDTTSETSLTFEYGSSKLVIPYATIESFEYSTEVAHHLGVVAGVAVALIKKRERQHFFRISYRDADHALQVAVFEVPKRMPRALEAILRARAPQGCKPHPPCAGRNCTQCGTRESVPSERFSAGHQQ